MVHAISFAKTLLSWYDENPIALPWRGHPDPYAVVVSEVMLQQTTVATVIPYYARFMARFPTPETLAAAPLDDVLGAWQGLGYYRRAQNLHKMARVLVSDHQGIWPKRAEDLKKLPGIGDYTAGAVASIVFGQPALALDGNGVRVLSRVMGFGDVVSAASPALRAFANAHVPQNRPGDFWQAVMDLGRTVCRPKNPACLVCPLRDHCVAWAAGTVAAIPALTAKKDRPHRTGQAFVLHHNDRVWLRRRPDTGLLARLNEPPTFGWESENAFVYDPMIWQPCGSVRHLFTHFSLDMQVFSAHQQESPFIEGDWHPQSRLPPLSTLAKKILQTSSFLVA
jgi:A/G-specific adenine glycosylase